MRVAMTSPSRGENPIEVSNGRPRRWRDGAATAELQRDESSAPRQIGIQLRPAAPQRLMSETVKSIALHAMSMPNRAGSAYSPATRGNEEKNEVSNAATCATSWPASLARRLDPFESFWVVQRGKLGELLDCFDHRRIDPDRRGKCVPP